MPVICFQRSRYTVPTHIGERVKSKLMFKILFCGIILSSFFLAKVNHINSANSYLDNHRSPLGGAVDEGQTREV